MTPRTLGRYQILSLLGEGGMGCVYKALDPVIGRTVAIKTLTVGLSEEELAEFKRRFLREARTAGRIAHPNVVTMYDVGEADGTPFIAMEYVEGRTLRSILDAEGALAPERACRIAVQVAAGLAAAHKLFIVHRDVKPANIMLTSGAPVKLMDFGIAKLPDGTKTQTGLILGSPIYVAPEQVIGRPVDGRSDVFSLGVVLYEMLTGSVPFGGMAVGALLYSVLNEAHPPPSAYNTRVPAVFERILARALAKHPDDRYQDAEELARDLRDWRALPRPTPEELASLREPPRRTLDRREAKR
ncbi:MAG: serine/threonine-protein kinase [Burkholderiales bacterium]